MYRVTTIAKMHPGKSATVMESRELGLEFFLPESGAGRSAYDLERPVHREVRVPTGMSGFDCKIQSV